MPVARLRARLVSMAAEPGITLIAVDPAIGRHALGHPIRMGARISGPGTWGCAQQRPPAAGRPRIPGPRTRSVRAGCSENAVDQNAQHRSGRSAEHGFWQQDSLPLSFQERLVATSVFSFISAWNDFLFVFVQRRLVSGLGGAVKD
jgi:hypothetical protein